MIFIMFLILVLLALPHWGLGARANLIISIVAVVLGALIIFSGWDGGFSIRARVD